MKGNFQLIVLVVFIALAIFGILVFSGAIPIGDDGTSLNQGTIVLWGTAKKEIVNPLTQEFNLTHTSYNIKYVEKSSETFDTDLLEALASGTGPDIILLPDNLAFHYLNKIYTVPFASYPLAAFRNSFASAGEVFLTSDGMLAFPIAIDPMVMYYNRAILDSNEVVYPPATWNELALMVPKLTGKDSGDKIIGSAVALGHFSNISHAKDILAALFMQSGSPIVKEKNGIFIPELDNSTYHLADVIKFYTDFANPTSTLYSWNKSLPNSSEAFSAGKVAFYFGYASELEALTNKNPNNNFFAAAFPQPKKQGNKVAMARVLGIATLSTSKNFNTAFTAAGELATGDFADKFAKLSGMVPARRDLLSVKQSGAFSPIFYTSALYAKSWLDPAPKETDDIWQKMIDSVISNSATPEVSLSNAYNKLNALLNRQ